MFQGQLRIQPIPYEKAEAALVPPPVETVKASKSKWLFVLYENEKAKHAFQTIDEAKKWFSVETE